MTKGVLLLSYLIYLYVNIVSSSNIVPLAQLRNYVFGGADLQYRIHYHNCSLNLAHISPYDWEQELDEIAYLNYNNTDWMVGSGFARDVSGNRLALKGPADRLTLSIFNASGLTNTLYDRDPATGKLVIPGFINCYHSGSFEILSRYGIGSELLNFEAVTKALVVDGVQLRFNLDLFACVRNATNDIRDTIQYSYAGRISGYRLDLESSITFSTSYLIGDGYHVVNVKMLKSNDATIKEYFVDQISKHSSDAKTWTCGIGSRGQLHLFQHP
ncbi:hypothetical protein LOTGIDRAFT_230495 [Lottia gigantea]|uniref:Uncharacterized protein n=1 Tax=Lottia gigantea TaxID=225164 RepID=V4B6A7_LOTGI|nr:hypothetical protein LOTGIDRAFT_230495 [Lottia gigantea]ESP03076.1 hypothetical protein LOTGIDRAFT_230495 [Lottia gigantea]